MESEFGLKARKTSAQGRVLGCPQQRQGTGQGAPDEPELTHRQFLSIPCTMVSCLDISSSPELISDLQGFSNSCFSLHRRCSGASRASAELLLSFLLLLCSALRQLHQSELGRAGCFVNTGCQGIHRFGDKQVLHYFFFWLNWG